MALSYWALIELSLMALLHSELRGSLISEFLAFEELSYVFLSKPSFLTPSDSDLRGSLITELLSAY